MVVPERDHGKETVMAAYETPEQAANFLAGIHLDILNTGKGDFSPNHVKYTCQLTPR